MKFKIWDAEQQEAAAVEAEAPSAYDAVLAHAERTWHPEMSKTMHLLARDEEGVLRIVDIYIEMQPAFDVWIKRADGEPEPSSSDDPCSCVDVPARHLDEDGHLPGCTRSAP